LECRVQVLNFHFLLGVVVEITLNFLIVEACQVVGFKLEFSYYLVQAGLVESFD
jgi:hypothetical protein